MRQPSSRDDAQMLSSQCIRDGDEDKKCKIIGSFHQYIWQAVKKTLGVLLLCGLATLVLLLSTCSGGGGSSDSGHDATPNIPAVTLLKCPGELPQTAQATAGTVTLAWDAVTVPNLDGYRVYYGAISGIYEQAARQGIDAGIITTARVTGLRSGTAYYFVVTAFDSTGVESGFSNEVCRTAP